MSQVQLGTSKEMLSHRCELIDDLVHDHAPAEVIAVHGSLWDGSLRFVFPEIDLSIDQPYSSMLSVPQPVIVNRDLPRKVVDMIRAELRAFTFQELTAIISPSARFSRLHYALSFLRFAEVVTAHLVAYRESELIKAASSKERGWNAQTTSNWNEMITNEHGVDLESIQDVASHFLGKTPKQICEQIMAGYRVIHCETVLRGDLSSRFFAKQIELREQMLKLSTESLRRLLPTEIRHGKEATRLQKEDIIDILVKPRLTFHGTRHASVASIVQYGFIKPGDALPGSKKAMEVRCGNTFGRGIYSSPSASYALSYSADDGEPLEPNRIPGIKLIVSATLMGRAAEIRHSDNWRGQARPYPGADSHVSVNQQEYIVFDAAQILPCYVLHLDWTDMDVRAFLVRQLERERRPATVRPDQDSLSPGDVQRLKQERLAQGRKFFAYGFGPVSGDRIVIEDIGAVDDDEENYGDYQGDRIDGVVGNTIWDWEADGETMFDEFSRARKTKAKHKAVSKGDEEDSE